eukprot:4835567-Prymnesium_polylepis.1
MRVGSCSWSTCNTSHTHQTTISPHRPGGVLRLAKLRVVLPPARESSPRPFAVVAVAGPQVGRSLHGLRRRQQLAVLELAGVEPDDAAHAAASG